MGSVNLLKGVLCLWQQNYKGICGHFIFILAETFEVLGQMCSSKKSILNTIQYYCYFISANKVEQRVTNDTELLLKMAASLKLTP